MPRFLPLVVVVVVVVVVVLLPSPQQWEKDQGPSRQRRQILFTVDFFFFDFCTGKK